MTDYSNVFPRREKFLPDRNKLAPWFYSGALLMALNFILPIASETRFFLLGVFLVAAWWSAVNRQRLPRAALWFILVYAIAAFRGDPYFYSSDPVTILQPVLSMLAVSAAFNVVPNLNPRIVPWVFLIPLVPCLAVIAWHSNELIFQYNPLVQVGSFNFNSYLVIAMVIGLVAISAAYLAMNDRRWWIKATALAIIGLGLVLLAGVRARGEALALLISLCILINLRLAVILSPLIAIGVQWVVMNFDTPLLERARLLSDGLGVRGEIWAMAIDMIVNNPLVLIFGAGLNGFQSANNLPLGLYPHNAYLEAMTAGGLLLTVPLLALTAKPVVQTIYEGLRNNVTAYQTYLLALSVFVLIAHMKSGTLMTMWVFGMMLPFFTQLSQPKLNRPSR